MVPISSVVELLKSSYWDQQTSWDLEVAGLRLILLNILCNKWVNITYNNEETIELIGNEDRSCQSSLRPFFMFLKNWQEYLLVLSNPARGNIFWPHHIQLPKCKISFNCNNAMCCSRGEQICFKTKVCPWFYLVKSCVSCVSPGFFVLLINTCNILVLISPWRILRKRIWWMRKNFLSLLAGQGRIQKWFGTNCPLACTI